MSLSLSIFFYLVAQKGLFMPSYFIGMKKKTEPEIRTRADLKNSIPIGFGL